MGFPRALPAEHEQILFELRPHWVTLLPAAAWALAVVVGLSVVSTIVSGVGLVAAGIVAAVALAVLTVVPALRWYFTRFVLTTDRFITQRGVRARRSTETALQRINDVTVTQSPVERLFDSGDLLIESEGERGQARIANVRRPDQVQLMIFRAAEENDNRARRGGQPFPTPAGTSIPEQIEALSRLRDQGVISNAEFEDKKQELLHRR